MFLGGLGRNRTTDTRIFNACGAQKVNVYGAYSGVSCYVLQNVRQQNHRKLCHVFTLTRLNFSVQQRYLSYAEQQVEARAVSQWR